MYNRVIQLYKHMLSMLFPVLFPLRLLQSVEQTSPHPAVGPCWVTVLIEQWLHSLLVAAVVWSAVGVTRKPKWKIGQGEVARWELCRRP